MNLRPAWKKGLLLGAKFALSGVLCWLVLNRVHFHEVAARLRLFDWRIAVVALGLWILNLGIVSWRWSILSLGQISPGDTFRYNWIGFFYGSVLPGAVSGDVAKGVSLGLKDKSQRAQALAASILIDKLAGVFTLLVLFNLAAGWLVWRRPEVFGALRAVALAGVAVSCGGLLVLVACYRAIGHSGMERWIALLPFARLRRGADWLASAFRPYRDESGAVLKALGLSLVAHSVVVGVYWMIFRSVEPATSLAFVSVFYAMISVILVVPITISGIGVREAFAATMFAAFALRPESGVAVSWLMLGLNGPIIIIGGLVQIAEFFRREKPLPS